MLYFILILMMIAGFLDGLIKLNSPAFKTKSESKNILDFLFFNN